MAESHERDLHFIGIGGSGMSPLAEIALNRGYHVTGSDSKVSSTIERLRSQGATIDLEQLGRFLSHGQTVVVSSAITATNPELTRAIELGLVIKHRSDLLKDLMSGKYPITIAGTHGKTTTTAMIAHMLFELGEAPTAAIGGTFVATNSGSLSGNGPWFVAEIDESDGSHVKQCPFIAVLTNVDKDHLDHFSSHSSLADSFLSYLQQIDSQGEAIVCWDDPGSHDVGIRYTGNRLSYGFKLGSEVRALDYSLHEGRSRFKAIVERDLLSLSLPIIGQHNVLNALSALAVARALELRVDLAAQALETFKGVKRRMTQTFESDTIKVFDDYAHNPGKIAACLAGIKECWPNHKLHAIYQAHRYSRLETMLNEMMGSFSCADTVTVLPVFAAGEVPRGDFSPATLAKHIERMSHVDTIACDLLENCVEDLVNSIEGPTIFITLGAGDIWKISQQLGEHFHEKGRAKQTDGP